MSRLEEKLIELGYRKTKTVYFAQNEIPYIFYEKEYCCRADICIILYDDKIEDYYVESDYIRFSKQQALNNLQQAFNEMQKDLEVLKEYE